MQPANCALLSRSFLLPHSYHGFFSPPLPSSLSSFLSLLPSSLPLPPSLPPSPLPYLSFNLSHTHTLSHQYLYAFTVTPLSEMDVHELIQQPPAVTDCPYTDLLRSKLTCSRSAWRVSNRLLLFFTVVSPLPPILGFSPAVHLWSWLSQNSAV